MKNKLKYVILYGFVLAVIFAFSGCGDSGNVESVESDGVDERIEESTMQDGVSQNYIMESFQVNTNQVIEEYHKKGYNYVWLKNHKIYVPEDGEIGDAGTGDIVELVATYIDEEGRYYITEDIEVMYLYWNETIGWGNSYETILYAEYDLTGLNETYWKVTDPYYARDFVNFIDDSAVREQLRATDVYYYGEGEAEVYFTFKNMETLWRKDSMSERILYGQTDVLEFVLVINGEIYRQTMQPYSEGIKIEKTYYTDWYIDLFLTNHDMYGNTLQLIYPQPIDAIGYHMPVESSSAEEFAAVLEGAVDVGTKEDNNSSGIDTGTRSCEVIPGITYESGSEEWKLYANIYDYGDGTMDIVGWGYENGVLLDELIFEATLYEYSDSQDITIFGNEDGTIEVYVEDGWYVIWGPDAERGAFIGDFCVVE